MPAFINNSVNHFIGVLRVNFISKAVVKLTVLNYGFIRTLESGWDLHRICVILYVPIPDPNPEALSNWNSSLLSPGATLVSSLCQSIRNVTQRMLTIL